MLSIDAPTLQEKLSKAEDIFLIDVREPWEHEAFNIGGVLMPMHDVFENVSQIPRDKPVVFYCQKGIRSALVIQRLEQKFAYNNLFNLTGGMQAWKQRL